MLLTRKDPASPDRNVSEAPALEADSRVLAIELEMFVISPPKRSRSRFVG